MKTMKITKFGGMLTLMTAVFTLIFMSVSSPVYAQGKKAGKADKKDTTEKKVKSYDFTGDEIDGDLIKPDGDFIDTRKFASYGNLIRIRQDFIREILKSAEDL